MSLLSDPDLRPLADRLAAAVPALEVLLVNAFALRGQTPKGAYESRVFLKKEEIRTTFLRKGGNPLRDLRLLCHTALAEGEASFDTHAAAIATHEQQLPHVTKECVAGAEIVRVLPFEDAPGSPQIVVRTEDGTGRITLEVRDAVGLSPVEAAIIADALHRAADLAGAHGDPRETEFPAE
jgi:hypothetical protein